MTLKSAIAQVFLKRRGFKIQYSFSVMFYYQEHANYSHRNKTAVGIHAIGNCKRQFLKINVNWLLAYNRKSYLG